MSHLTSAALFCAALVLFFFTVAGNHGLLQLQKINNELDVFERKNRGLEAEIVQVDADIAAIQQKSYLLEQRAREELGYARPNEVVYVFSEKRVQTPLMRR